MGTTRKHLDDLLDEALAETFPASDPVSIVRSGGFDGPGPVHSLPRWLVRAVWTEDDTEATEQWEVGAASADEARGVVAEHLHFRPHHVEVARKN